MQAGVEIYFLLLVAVIAGWLLGRLGRGGKSAGSRQSRDMLADYFLGLNYLLNDEPDEAIDTFIRGLEVNSDTIETHLALGALLRRRGKVDKAIKVHQALLARPGLEQHFVDSTRLQLATDYIAAGLLDRAERLLNEILEEDTSAKWEALSHLVIVYQTEKEWLKAIDVSRHLLTNSAFRRNAEVRSRAAHYCCELVDELLADRQYNKSREWIKKAFTFDRHSVRATLLLADIEQKSGNYRAAVRELLRVCRNSPEYTGQLLDAMGNCYSELNERREFERVLRELLAEHNDIHVALALAKMIQSAEGDANAIQFLNRQLEHTPYLAGVLALLRMQVPKATGELQVNLHRLQSMIDLLLSKRPHYRCEHCGYEAKLLNWLCPSCKKWDKMKPILEVSKLWN